MQLKSANTFKHLRKDYYPKSYTGRGECPACGSFNHRMELHKDGFAVICESCGDWECHHERGRNRLSHRSNGAWTALRGRPQLPESIANCSAVAQAIADEPGPASLK